MKKEFLVWSEKDSYTINATDQCLRIEFKEKTAQPLRELERSESDLRFLSNYSDILQDEELLLCGNGVIDLKYEGIYRLQELGARVFDGLLEWSPFTLEIRNRRSIGERGFGFEWEFKLGNKRVVLLEAGCLLSDASRSYVVSKACFQLLTVMREFNDLPEEKKELRVAFETLSRMQGLLPAIEGIVDPYLANEKVIVPSQIGIGIKDEKERLSLFPSVAGVKDDEMWKAFKRTNEISSVYDLQGERGSRVRVVFSDDIQEALKDLQRVRHVSGGERVAILADPISCLSDGVNRDIIDLSYYSKRVIGMSIVPLKVEVEGRKSERGWFEIPGKEKVLIILRAETESGSVEIPINDRDELAELLGKCQKALESGERVVSFKDFTILVTADLIAQLERLLKPHEKKTGADSRANLWHLQIYTNEEKLEFAEEENLGEITEKSIFELPILPATLRDEVKFKQHQREGLRWLQRLYFDSQCRRGCILADDMGLGKTLQILSLLSVLLANLEDNRYGLARVPYRPILIVVPKILLTHWDEEMETYFQPHTFQPRVILYGKRLDELKKRELKKEKELVSGKAVLDIESLCSYRAIITNYDTVKNYQLSLGQIDWSVIIADEGQEIRNANHVSYAMKALKARFRIVSTGTPVENSLLDLWNLMDFAHPGALFGSAKEFKEHYLDPKLLETKREELVDDLRERLRFGKEDAFLLRRTKEQELKDLPKKIPEFKFVDLSDKERNVHIEVARRALEITSRGGSFGPLMELRKLAEGLPIYEEIDDFSRPKDFLKEVPKVSKLVELLKEVQKRQEKAIIFAWFRRTQLMLQSVLREEFGLNVHIISGTPCPEARNMVESRRERIKEFESKEGFNVIILSPEVAGVGLTIVGANHVIHYGRLWNPAKEDQATDRAYRIGQTKDVYVYVLISRDPQKEFTTFDENLHLLLEEKRSLAKDFLMPVAELEVSSGEVMQGTASSLGEGGKVKGALLVRTDGDIRRLTSDEFEALTALLYEADGYKVLINGRPGDHGIDLIALKGRELCLIQCKQQKGGGVKNSLVVEQLRNGFEHYFDLVKKRSNWAPKLVATSNGVFDRETVREAEEREIELIAGKKFIKMVNKENISLTAIRIRNDQRIKSDLELIGAIR